MPRNIWIPSCCTPLTAPCASFTCGVAADDVRRLLGEGVGADAASIGSVAMRDTYCHVRVPAGLADRIVNAANGKSHGDVTIKVELARA